MKNVAIVILNWNGIKDTQECLKSISKLQITRSTSSGQANYKLQVIVVDNGSKEKFAIKDLKLKNININVIINEENLGFAGGNNVGIRYALTNGADYICILNNDTIVEKNLIAKLIQAAEPDRVGIVGPKIYFAPGFEFHKQKYKKEERGRVIWYGGGVMDWNNVIGYHRGVDEIDNGQYDTEGETAFASGCCMLVKRALFESVGLLNEKYFLYYEDSDFSERAKKKGYTIIYAPEAIIWHKNAGSAGGSGSSLQDYYMTRNRLLFGLRYAPFRSKLALLRESIAILFRGRIWQKIAVSDFYMGKFGKGSYKI